MKKPDVATVLHDRKNRVTYRVLAYRTLSPHELGNDPLARLIAHGYRGNPVYIMLYR